MLQDQKKFLKRKFHKRLQANWEIREEVFTYDVKSVLEERKRVPKVKRKTKQENLPVQGKQD